MAMIFIALASFAGGYLLAKVIEAWKNDDELRYEEIGKR